MNLLDLNKESILEKKIFDELFKYEGFEHAQRKAKLEGRAKELHVVRSFNAQYKAYALEKVKNMRAKDSHKTNFLDCDNINCGRWIANDSGVRSLDYNPFTGETKTKEASSIPILPTQILENIDSGIEKIRLKYKPDKDWKELICEKVTISSNSRIVELANRGLSVTTETAKHLIQYLKDCVDYNQLPRNKSISRLGWVDEEFMPYDTNLVFDAEKEYKYLYDAVHIKGSLEKWVAFMTPLRRNTCFRLIMAASFSSVLIHKVSALPFVVHAWGPSGTGKTVALMCAASVWGDPAMGRMTRTMNMTANSMMSTAAFLHHIPFFGDELQSIKTRWDNYDSLIMKITEGIDRGRMSYDRVNETKTWRSAFIFTGEEPCLCNESGGGVKNRVIDIECSDSIIHNGNETVNFILKNYGHAGKTFVEAIKSIALRDRYSQIFQAIIALKNTTEKQAYSMAILILADELSCRYLFHDQPLNLKSIVEYLLLPSDVDVAISAYDYTLSLVSANISNFSEEGFKNEFWGKIEGDALWINKQILVRELNKAGFSFEAVKKRWVKEGYIVKDSQGKYQHQRKINLITTNFIVFRLKTSWQDLSS